MEDISLQLPIPYGATSYTDNGIVWRVLKDNRPPSGTVVASYYGKATTSNGDGSVLIITDRIYDSNGTAGWGGSTWGDLTYNTANKYTTYENSAGTLKTLNNAFYQSTVSSTLKATATIPTLRYESGPAPDELSAGLSTAGARAAATTNGIVFPLSWSEVNSYMGTSSESANRAATDMEGTARDWWVRSPGYGSADIPGDMGTNGIANYGTYTGVCGSRPALWLDATP